MSFVKDLILSKVFKLIKSWKRPYFDFSQLGEEKILFNILERISNKNKINQYYIDIGGFSPILYSNTYKLYQKKWCGVIVEPNKNKTKYWKKIRPKDLIINQALVPNSYNNNKIKIYYDDENTAMEKKKPDFKNKFLKSYESNTIKLNEVISICEKKFSKPFFLNIDIEGSENEIILELENINYKIPLICVELFLDTQSKSFSIFNYKNMKSVSFLEDNGYILVSICGPSLIFCDKNLWVPFSN